MKKLCCSFFMILILFSSSCFASGAAPAKFFLAENNIASNSEDFSRNIDHRCLYDKVAEHFVKELGLQLVVTDGLSKYFLDNGCQLFRTSRRDYMSSKLVRACRKENIKYIVYYNFASNMEHGSIIKLNYPENCFSNSFQGSFSIKLLDVNSRKYVFAVIGRSRDRTCRENAKYQREFFTDLIMKAFADCLANGKWQELKKLL